MKDKFEELASLLLSNQNLRESLEATYQKALYKSREEEATLKESIIRIMTNGGSANKTYRRVCENRLFQVGPGGGSPCGDVGPLLNIYELDGPAEHLKAI